MDSTSVSIMIGICAIGIASLALMVITTYLQPYLMPIRTWYRNKRYKQDKQNSGERLVKQYLQQQHLSHSLFQCHDRSYTLSMFLNQSEIEFSTADLNQTRLKNNLEKSLEASVKHYSTSEAPLLAPVNQLPQGHGHLLCLSLAGFSVAKAALTLIGSENYLHELHPKVIKKITSPGFLTSHSQQTMQLLRSGSPFPWAMVDIAFDYWSLNSTLINQLRMQLEQDLDPQLIKQVILSGYKVGLYDNLIKHYAQLSA